MVHGLEERAVGGTAFGRGTDCENGGASGAPQEGPGARGVRGCPRERRPVPRSGDPDWRLGWPGHQAQSDLRRGRGDPNWPFGGTTTAYLATLNRPERLPNRPSVYLRRSAGSTCRPRSNTWEAAMERATPRYVCVHGHFYQPPRENPWLEALEVQDAAYPYHDWNERITAECYAPNSASRILDG